MKKWLHFAIYIGTIATTLLNFIPPEDTVGLISAGLFTFAALAAIAYSAIIFVYRAYSIRNRLAEGMYYDKYGVLKAAGAEAETSSMQSLAEDEGWIRTELCVLTAMRTKIY